MSQNIRAGEERTAETVQWLNVIVALAEIMSFILICVLVTWAGGVASLVAM